MELARVAVPGGHVSAAGGNYFHARSDLSLDTRLGPFTLGAVYNSAWGWTFSLDATYKSGTLRDATGASIPLGTLVAGAAAPGTHWVKLDATRVKTKGGLVHEFDPVTGRLVATHWSSSPYPRLRFVQAQVGGQWRTSAVEQCTAASACAPVLALGYDANARLVRADDRAGRSARYAYDTGGRLAAAQDGLDVARGWPGERYTYAGGFLASITSAEGERIEIASDAQGRATEVRAVGAGNPTWRFRHGAVGATGLATTTVTDPLGFATAFVVDASARVLSVTNPLGERTDYTWSGLRPASRTLPDGTRTEWAWSDDDLASESQPSGNLVRFAYQADGVDRERPFARALLEHGDALGVIERRAYDASGRLASITNGAGETTSFSWGADEALASVTAPDGVTLQLANTGEHGKATRVSLDGVAWSDRAFDAVGNPTRALAPSPYSGGARAFAYDEDRNLAAIVLADLPRPPGSAQTHTVRLEYRSDHRLARVVRPYGGETLLVRDALGRVSEERELVSPGATPAPAPASTMHTYDANGRLLASELANGMRRERSYDAAGRLASLRWLRGATLEAEVAFQYAAGRLVAARSPDASFDESFTWDSAGRLVEQRHTLGERTRFGWDARSRVASASFVMPNGIQLAELVATYDGADRQTGLAAVGLDLVRRTFSGGRVATVLYGNGLNRRSTRTTPHGLEGACDLFRGATRIARGDYQRGTGFAPELQAATLALSGSGALNGTLAESYAFAAESAPPGADRRLASALGTSGYPESFAYDALSNLVEMATIEATPFGAAPASRTIAFNAEHSRALETTWAGFLAETWRHAYDAAGYEISRTRLASPTHPARTTTFAFTAAGQLASIATDGVVETALAYDPLGRRLSLETNGALRRWRFAGVVETDAADAPVAIDLGDVRIAFDGAHRYRHRDVRGNIQLVSDAAGSVVSAFRYGAFGESLAQGAPSDAAGFANGAEIATGAGSFVLLGDRLLDPRSGRFLSPDPVWNPLNAYAYTLGNPVDFWDESGLHPGHAGGADDHKAIELARIERNSLVAMAASAAIVGGVLRSAPAIGAAVAAVIAALEEHLKVRTLEKFHEAEYPVSFDPGAIPDIGAPFPGSLGELRLRRGTVTICDDPDIHPC
jgi:RHS repeat-associated protein